MDIKSGDYTVLEVSEISCNALKEDDLWQVFVLWKKWAAGRGAPAWRDIDLLSLPPKLIPQTTVVDVINDGEDFLYRFWGSGYAEHYGVESTGNLLSRSLGASFVAATFKQFQDVIAQSRPIAYEVIIRTTLTDAVQSKINLRLPIEDRPGRVTKILTSSQFSSIPIRDADRIREAVWNGQQKLNNPD